jgi:hypothetical protein
LKDIQNTATKISKSKMATANAGLQDVYKTFGYKDPRSDETGAIGSKPAAGGNSPQGIQVGQTVKLKNGATAKIKAVHPDGSFDTE